MKRFKYVGPHDEVEIPALGTTVKNGDTVDVENTDISGEFEGQGDWEHIPVKQSKD